MLVENPFLVTSGSDRNEGLATEGLVDPLSASGAGVLVLGVELDSKPGVALSNPSKSVPAPTPMLSPAISKLMLPSALNVKPETSNASWTG